MIEILGQATIVTATIAGFATILGAKSIRGRRCLTVSMYASSAVMFITAMFGVTTAVGVDLDIYLYALRNIALLTVASAGLKSINVRINK